MLLGFKLAVRRAMRIMRRMPIETEHEALPNQAEDSVRRTAVRTK